MKNFVLGILVTVCLLISGNVLAQGMESWIGKEVEGEFPVTVDGLQLDAPAAVIDGRTFLPVREFGEATGYNVHFDETGEVILEKKSDQIENDSEVTVDVESLQQMTDDELIKKQRDIDIAIGVMNQNILNEQSKENPNPDKVNVMSNELNKFNQIKIEVGKILNSRGIDTNSQNGVDEAELEKKIQELEKSIDHYQGFIDRNSMRINGLEEEISELSKGRTTSADQDQIESRKRGIERSNQQIEQYQQRISELEKKISEYQSRIDQATK